MKSYEKNFFCFSFRKFSICNSWMPSKRKKDSFLSYHIPKIRWQILKCIHKSLSKSTKILFLRSEELTCSSSPRLLLSDYDYFAFEWLYISYYHDPFSYLHISYSVVTRREHAKGSLDQIQRRLPSRALSKYIFMYPSVLLTLTNTYMIISLIHKIITQ